MKIICSWCNKLMGEKEPFDDPSETHAKCDDCLKRQKQDNKTLYKKEITPGRSDFPSRELLEKTIQVWQPYSKRPLNTADAREIITNACGFFKLLAELDQKYGGGETKNPTA